MTEGHLAIGLKLKKNPMGYPPFPWVSYDTDLRMSPEIMELCMGALLHNILWPHQMNLEWHGNKGILAEETFDPWRVMILT